MLWVTFVAISVIVVLIKFGCIMDCGLENEVYFEDFIEYFSDPVVIILWSPIILIPVIAYFIKE